MNDSEKSRNTFRVIGVPVCVGEISIIPSNSHQNVSFLDSCESGYRFASWKVVFRWIAILAMICSAGCRHIRNNRQFDFISEYGRRNSDERATEVHPCENCGFGKCDRRRCAPRLIQSDDLCSKLEHWNECRDCNSQIGFLEKLVGRKRVGHCWPVLCFFGIGRRCQTAVYSEPWTEADDERVMRDARLFFTLDKSIVADGLRIQNEDIVASDGEHFSRYLDGSDVGLENLVIDAFTLIGPMEILISFSKPFSVGEQYNLPGLEGEIDDSDIMLFRATQLGEITRGSFELYFDGSDVGLTEDGEDIDALASTKNGTIIVSTVGDVHVANLSGKDEDLFEFRPDSTGENTSGTWKKILVGSKIGLASRSTEDIDAISVGINNDLFLSTRGPFNVKVIAGTGSDVFQLIPVKKTGSQPERQFSSQFYFDGNSLIPEKANISGISLPFENNESHSKNQDK